MLFYQGPSISYLGLMYSCIIMIPNFLVPINVPLFQSRDQLNQIHLLFILVFEVFLLLGTLAK